jgi:hypothetical protein
MTFAANAGRNQGSPEICQRTLGMEHDMAIIEPLHHKLLLCEEEGWQIATSTGLLTPQ